MMPHHELSNQKQTKDRPISAFFVVTALLLMTFGMAVVVGARALLGARTAASSTLPVKPSLDEETAHPARTAQSLQGERPDPPEPSRARTASGPELRFTVPAAVAPTPEVHDSPALAGLLTELEKTARSNHRVTAFEVEPGLVAIRAHYAGDDAELQRRASEFGTRMANLSASFEPVPQPDSYAP